MIQQHRQLSVLDLFLPVLCSYTSYIIQYHTPEKCFFFFVSSSISLSSSTRRFYPKRSSAQDVVKGVVPSPPRYVPSIFIAHRVQLFHSAARRFSLHVANSRSRAFR